MTFRVRQFIGFVLLAGTALSVVQAIREVAFWETGPSTYDEVSIQQSAFSFAGRLITIQNRWGTPIAADSTKVPQERLLIDGVAVGRETGLRMRNWPVGYDMRSANWFNLVKFTDRDRSDSSVWFARRLQAADSVLPIVEIVRIDANGRYQVETRGLNELRTDYHVARIAQFLAEDAPSGYPYSMSGLLFFPILLLVHPLGTVLLGVWLMRRRKDSRAAV